MKIYEISLTGDRITRSFCPTKTVAEREVERRFAEDLEEYEKNKDSLPVPQKAVIDYLEFNMNKKGIANLLNRLFY